MNLQFRVTNIKLCSEVVCDLCITCFMDKLPSDFREEYFLLLSGQMMAWISFHVVLEMASMVSFFTAIVVMVQSSWLQGSGILGETPRKKVLVEDLPFEETEPFTTEKGPRITFPKSVVLNQGLPDPFKGVTRCEEKPGLCLSLP